MDIIRSTERVERRYLTTAEVAELCRASAETVRWWRFKGDYGPPSFKVGRRVLYDATEVEKWLEGLQHG